VVINNLDVVGVAVAKFETNSPTAIDDHRPLTFAFAFELVQANPAFGNEKTIAASPDSRGRRFS
jgi:hypothetical protein